MLYIENDKMGIFSMSRTFSAIGITYNCVKFSNLFRNKQNSVNFQKYSEIAGALQKEQHFAHCSKIFTTNFYDELAPRVNENCM